MKLQEMSDERQDEVSPDNKEYDNNINTTQTK